jgi:hypothetical protein
MVALQLHGIPEWIALAGARPGEGVRSRAQRKVQTSGYSTAGQAEAYGIRTHDHVALRGDLLVNVGSDIIKAAKESDCDLIVMATHLPGFKDHIFSSNGGYVASHAPMTVYVVR